MSRLEEIRAREEKASPGPWSVADINGEDVIESEEGYQLAAMLLPYPGVPGVEEQDANARFIASARDDVPFLLSEIERLERSKR